MKRYHNLDGLRSMAAIGVIMLHILANSGKFGGGTLTAYLLYDVAAGFGSLVQLFFLISGFSMCCGYYEKIKENKITLDGFYGKRYIKILPFFLLLSFIDIAVALVFDGGASWGSLVEVFANATLMFGFYASGGMSVIGVGWTLGVIFGFYILFPFFVYMIWTKGRAWIALAVTVGIALAASLYFGVGRGVAFPWLCYFVAGGLIYLYRESLGKWFRHPAIGIGTTVLGFVLAFFVPTPDWGPLWGEVFALAKTMAAFTLMVVGAMCADTPVWHNPLTKLISRFSLEIYLSHMLIFRVIQKMGILRLLGDSVWAFLAICVMVLLGALAFAFVWQWAWDRAVRYFQMKFKKQTIQ